MCEALLYLAVNKTRSAFCVVIFFPLFDARMNPPDTRLPSFCVVNSSFSRISNQFSAYSKLRTFSKKPQRPSKNDTPVSIFLRSLPIRKKMSSHNLDGKIPSSDHTTSSRNLEFLLTKLPSLPQEIYFFAFFSDPASTTLFVVNFHLSRIRFSPKSVRLG